MKNTISKIGMLSAALLVSAAGLSSCSKDDDNTPDVPRPSKEAISFNVTVPKAARGVTTTSSINDFSVWAFTGNELFMNNVKVNREGSVWNYSPTMFWPADNAEVNFYCVSPTIPGNVLTATPTPDIPGFINNTGSVDLLYAVNMKQTADETGQVKVNFRHALSQVRFLLSRKSDPSVNPIRVEINKVELVNIASKGDFQMPRATTSAVTTDRGEWTNLGNIQNVTLYDGKSKTLTDTPTEYNTPGYIFSIPQELLASVRQGNSFNGAWLSVRCSIYDDVSGVRLWPSTTDLGYENGFALLYFPLNADDSRYPEWEPGKAYSYGISIGVPQGSSAIDFDVTVDEYGDFLQ